MNALSPSQRRTVQHLMNTGLVHAAHSFSQMVNREVTVEASNLVIARVATADAIIYQPGDTTLLVTDIVGEVGGRSYLLFSEPAGATLQRAFLPTVSDTHQCSVMGEAFLKEIDNIVSAAMITKLSEALDLRIFGGVPHLLRLSTDEMKQKLHEDFSQEPDEDFLLVNARFLFNDSSPLQLPFFWTFPAAFLHYLEGYLQAAHSDTLR